jgi:hypothetical protein
MPVAIIVPKAAAPGKPWVFRADFVTRDAAVDLALLGKGGTRSGSSEKGGLLNERPGLFSSGVGETSRFMATLPKNRSG